MTKPHKVEQGYMHENYRKLIHNVEEKVLFCLVSFTSGIEKQFGICCQSRKRRQEWEACRGLVKPVGSSFIADITGKAQGSLFRPAFLGEGLELPGSGKWEWTDGRCLLPSSFHYYHSQRHGTSAYSVLCGAERSFIKRAGPGGCFLH